MTDSKRTETYWEHSQCNPLGDTYDSLYKMMYQDTDAKLQLLAKFANFWHHQYYTKRLSEIEDIYY